jgi:small-conductance mechanosensitive channel
MTEPVVNLTRYPARRASVWLAVPADEAEQVDREVIREALSKVSAISTEPPPAVDLRSVSNGQARFEVTFWARERDAGVAAAVAALRARFPQSEVHGA